MSEQKDEYRVLYTEQGIEKMSREPVPYNVATDKAADLQMDGREVVAVITEEDAQLRMAEAEALFRVKYRTRGVPGHRYTRRPMTHDEALTRAQVIGGQEGIVGALVVPASEGPADNEDPYFDLPLYLKAHRDVETEVDDSLDEDVPQPQDPEACQSASEDLGYVERQTRHYSLDLALRLAEANKGATLEEVLTNAESFLGFLLVARP